MVLSIAIPIRRLRNALEQSAARTAGRGAAYARQRVREDADDVGVVDAPGGPRVQPAGRRSRLRAGHGVGGQSRTGEVPDAGTLDMPALAPYPQG